MRTTREEQQLHLALRSEEQLQAEYWAWHDATEKTSVRDWIDFADDKRNRVAAELRRRGAKVRPR